ncbi:MAG: hypothetical protein Q8O67_02115 [Deltaproteobacteria bacterium]|nr:hypothetical protein [Deltaproteobacteria bacterium]
MIRLSLALVLVIAACDRAPDTLDFGAAKAANLPKGPVKAPPPPSAATRVLAPPTHPSGVGTNLAELRDYSPERPFNDVFKQSRDWISSTASAWDDKRPVDVDARGWVKELKPGQFARSLVFWGDGLKFPKGSYTVTWKGTGEIDFAPQGGTVTSTANGTHKLEVDPGKGGLAVLIMKTDPKDPIRDIRVLLPGVDPAAAAASPYGGFNPVFLERLKGYSTLRFMDWMDTNASHIKTAAERPVPDDARYTVKGVPMEVMIDLCNAAGADAWINTGHTWGDDLVEAAAVVARDKLKPGLRVYVEHSNEIWNGQFPQANYVREKGVAAGLSKDVFDAQLRYHAQRSVEVHNIFDKIFAAAVPSPPGGAGNRVVRVLGAWAANAWSSGTMLDHLKENKWTVDALAIAPYFGNSLGEPEQRGAVQGMGLADLMKRLEASVDESLVWVKEQKKLADKHKVQLISYEGGQHLVGIGPVSEDAHINNLFDAANIAPAMKPLYARYLKGWKDSGGGLFVHFTSTMRGSKYGRWGSTESMEQPRAEAPKYDALMTFIETTPRWY